MAKRKSPRLIITVPKDVKDTLDALREATGTNISGMISMMLQEATPAFQKLIAAHMEAQNANTAVLETARYAVREAAKNAQKQAQEFEKQLDQYQGKGKCKECGKTAELGDLCNDCEDKATSDFVR